MNQLPMTDRQTDNSVEGICKPGEETESDDDVADKEREGSLCHKSQKQRLQGEK